MHENYNCARIAGTPGLRARGSHDSVAPESDYQSAKNVCIATPGIYPDNYTFAVRWVDRGGCIPEYACGGVAARPWHA